MEEKLLVSLQELQSAIDSGGSIDTGDISYDSIKVVLEFITEQIKENKKWEDKIKAKIEKLKVLAEKADDETLNACELDIRKNQIYLLDNLLNGETTIKI